MEASRLKDVSSSMIRRMFEIVEEAKREGKDIVSLTIGEPDFDTPYEVVERAFKAMKSGFTHYTSNYGIPELREAIAERYEVDPSWVMVTTGASEALLNASLAFIEEGSKVLIPSPSFLSYYTYAKLCKAEILEMRTHDDGFLLNPDKLNEVMDKDVSVLFINYPNNPTGAVMDQREMDEVAETAEKRIIISDEIYDAIFYDKKPGTLAGRENVVVVNGFSKSLSMTGWRIGYVVAEPKLLDSILKIHQVNGVCAPAFAQKAVAEIISDELYDELVLRMVSEFRKRRDYVYSELQNFCINKPEGAFYLFYRAGEDCLSYVKKLLDYGVAVTPGKPFGSWNNEFVRISYATSIENLKKAVERIKRYHEDRC